MFLMEIKQQLENGRRTDDLQNFFVFSSISVVYASRQIIHKSILFNKFIGTNHRKQTSASILYTLCCRATFSSFFCLCKLLANFKLYVFFQCLNPALILYFSCTKLVSISLIISDSEWCLNKL